MYVYVAGPLSADVYSGVRNAIANADVLLDAGHTPFIPHLTHLWCMVAPRPYEDWMEYDLKWVQNCEWVLRIPGPSPGADREVEFAQKERIPVFFGLAGEFLEHLGEK